MWRKQKKYVVWHKVKSKVSKNGKSAAKARIEQSSTTIPLEGSTHKRVEVGSP